MRRMFGAPSGAVTSFGKSLTDSEGRRPIFPRNGGSGRGKTSWATAEPAPMTYAQATSVKLDRVLMFNRGMGLVNRTFAAQDALLSGRFYRQPSSSRNL